ncbi:MAG: TatD family deoxyribonuclease [Gammaproteobacteria bacterium]|nr:TatD family deoxyribonuclease [Gammaproteobacteria bacterium]
MNGWIDSHCHPQLLPSELWNEQTEGLINLLMVSVELSDAEKLMSIAKEDRRAHWSAGVHPCHSPEEKTADKMVELEHIVQTLNPDALGETGLDLFHDTGTLTQQYELFEHHLELGKKYSKPVIIHTRNAGKETLSVLRKYIGVNGVIHCFTESKEFAESVLDLGWLISFSGILTFPKAIDLQKTAQYIPLDRIMIETDAPYLAPVPYRGKPNIPAYVRHTGEFLAILRNISCSSLQEQLKKNYEMFLSAH